MLSILVVFLKSYWKQILGTIILLTAIYAAYSKVYNLGYSAANAECAKVVKKYELELDKRIAVLESASNVLVVEAIESRKALKKDFSTILNSIKNKPLYVVKQDGKCAPSEDLIRVYNDAVNRANQQ